MPKGAGSKAVQNNPPEIFDPLTVIANASETPLLTTTAAEIPIRAPNSPISGQTMETVQVGAYGQQPFSAWVHYKDRIILPKRE